MGRHWYQMTFGEKPTRNSSSSQVAPVASKPSFNQAAAILEPAAKEWRETVGPRLSDIGCLASSDIHTWHSQ
jgi:hypothetical protein